MDRIVDGTPSASEGSAGPSEPSGDQAPYLNRELSWLEFNARVLTLAEDTDRPLLERVKFLAIAGSNLDEFFQIRVAGLKEQVRLGIGTSSPDGMTPMQQLQAIAVLVQDQVDRQGRVYTEDISVALESQGIRFVTAEKLDGTDREYLDTFYRDRIFPVLTPLAVDPAHPFPYISNLSLNLAVWVRDPGSGVRRFARVKVPPLLPRFVSMPDHERFVPLEQVIATHLQALFPGMDVLSQHPFRVTRNADLELEEEEAGDLLIAIEEELRRRRRNAQVVRLEIERSMSEEVRDLLMRELELEPGEVYVTQGLLGMGELWALYDLDRPDLKDEPWKAPTQPRLAGSTEEPADVFAILRGGDVLVHHPYDAFASSVEAFVSQAAADPRVLAIKQTLYRTSGEESPIVRSLIRAAEAGKQVVALVELKARFDEQANIAWARALEEAGVHVVYGVVGLKTHAKISLVVRQEESGIRRYAHIGTGNYNPATATIYEDVGLLTSDPKLGSDLSDLFNYLTGYSRKRRYGGILVSPLNLRDAVLELIGQEAEHTDGQIVIKVNNLVDTEIIDALYRASQAGADVDLIVRSICCLRPGVPGLSERIRVRSIVGRYLEHARILRFGSRQRGRRYFIGSADLMPRNLDRRVEALTPVNDPNLCARLDQILEVNLSDDHLAWSLQSDGSWRRVPASEGVNTHNRLQEIALARMHGDA